jgi:hypothetical protein
MSTAPQIAANQANAQHSTGPRTESGKLTASQNSVKHGLTSKSALIAGEDPGEYHAHTDQYFAEHNPTTIDEKFLVKQMSDSMWRLNRIQRLEAAIFEKSEKSPEANPLSELLKLARYQKSLESTYFRAGRELRAIRKDEAKTVTAQKTKQAAEISAALDEIMYAPLPEYPKRTQSTVSIGKNVALRL